jgi:Glycine rich protein
MPLQKYMKTPRWFAPTCFLSHLRIPAAVTLISAAAAMALLAAPTAPSIAWSPTTSSPPPTYDYGTISSGTASKTFTLTNSGGTATSALKVTLTLASGSSGFTITSDACSATSLGPKKTCTVSVSYAVTADGESDSATLTASSKKPNTTASLKLTAESATHQTFSYTGAAQTFTVPAGVTLVTVDAVGAAGGSAGGTAGLGEEIQATLTVTPGDVLNVFVGGTGGNGFGGGSSGFNGGGIGKGGGGGASDIRIGGTTITPTDYRVIVAGGGGGAQAFSTGGNAGFLSGSPGSLVDFDVNHTAATGGTPTAGGSAGTGGEGNATGGSLGTGGNSDHFGVNYGGGGGGGGFYGGGGGADNDGGGGGSSHIVSPATHVSDNLATAGQCDASNNGCITISW